VVIINQALARAALGAANPLGRRLTFPGDRESHEIIGVVGDAKYLEIREATPATVYLATFQKPAPDSQFVIRTSIPPTQITAAVRREVHNLSKPVMTGKITTLAESIDASIVQERLIAMLSSIFGALGSILAAIGLYGLLAYMVVRRTREIGIRMAIGARRAEVVRMVLREGLLLVIGGLALGIPASIAAERIAASAIPDLSAGNAGAIAFAALGMLAVAAIAACVPAYRASRVDPMRALRHE
jgi:ABC-type antimicrobial peptide transport system permease subunit